MKRFFTIIISISLICCAIGLFACKEEKTEIPDDESFVYRALTDEENTVGYSISGAQIAENGEVIIPSQYKGLPVTEIDGYAFYECAEITSLTIPESVTAIGDSAFYNCENLKSLTLNGKISDMGELTFAHCEKLESVKIGDKVEEISYYAFFECSALKEVTIPASVKTIGESAFSFCTSLKKVTFNEGLEYIGDCAFGGCFDLEEFIMPQSVTEIGFGVLMFVGGFFFDGEVFDGTNSVKKIVMSDNITDIPDFAFSGCAIPTIAIGKKVEKINYSAFYGCEWLESVIIPKSVKQIASYAFYNCFMLNTVYYDGTAEEWTAVKIGKNGNDIVNAVVYYYSESKPSQTGNFWHYSSDGAPVKW